MSEALKLAIQRLDRDPVLQEKIRQNPPKNIAEMVEFLSQIGITVSEADFMIGKEFSPDSLEQVSGGKGNAAAETPANCADLAVYIFCSMYCV